MNNEADEQTERVAEVVVKTRWQGTSEWLHRHDYPAFAHLAPLVDALMHHARLGCLFPYTSHATLCLSRCTEYPFSPDCPSAVAEGQSHFRLFGPRYYLTEGEGTQGLRWWQADPKQLETRDIAAAVAWMDDTLPPDCGPAVLGNEDELLRHLGLPIRGALTEDLFIAVMRGPEAMASVLARGADVNDADYHGMTPLMLAVIGGRKESLQMLLERKADVHRRNSDGETALSLAVARRDEHPEIVSMLVQAGARE